MKFQRTEWFGLAALLLLAAGQARSQLDAAGAEQSLAVVDALHAGLISLGTDEVAASGEARYAALEPLIRSTHDLAFIAERTIRRQWRDLGDADRQAFLAAFERLSVMTYASRFRSVGENTFRVYEALDAGSGRVQVRAAIVRPETEDIPLDYVLHDTGDGWRIINILADGVSDLALKRAEYQRVLSQGGFEDLIDYLREQAAALD